MKYRREIDGLRAVAVVPVILFHAGFAFFSGGFVGVDVFFVISGYLITGILIGDLEGQKFSIARFYERRARRILPALFFVMLACIPFALLWMTPAQFRGFSRSLIAVPLFSSNFLFWREAGYFAADANLKPLLHTWSLAVEEQFYVLFPLFLALVWRFEKRRVFQILLGLAILSLAIAQLASIYASNANFFLAPSRAWELFAGSLCALLLDRTPPRSNSVFSLVGLGMILASVVLYDETTPFPSFYALLPVGGTAMIILFGGSECIVGRALGGRIPVGIGLISYSAYLWHQPLFAFARIRSVSEPSELTFILLALLSLALAYLSWRFVEMPFRRGLASPLPTRKRVFIAAAASTVAMVCIGVLFVASYPLFKREWLASRPFPVRRAYQLIEATPALTSNWGQTAKGQKLSECRFNTPDLDGATKRQLDLCAGKYGAGTLVLGDSHAIDLFGEVASRFNAPFVVGLTKPFCRPQDETTGCQYEALLDFLSSHPVFEHLIFEEAGFCLLEPPGGQPCRRELIAASPLDKPLRNVVVSTRSVQQSASYLRRLAKLVPVTWFGPRLEPQITDAMAISRGCQYPFALRPNEAEVFARLDAALRQSVANTPNLRFVSQIETMRYTFPADYMNCRERYWSDGDHLSTEGEVRFGKRLPADFLQFPKAAPSTGDHAAR